MLRRLTVTLVALAALAGGALAVTATSAAADQTISAKALTDHECNADEWHFVITQIDSESDAPATIHVTWANNDEEDVPLSAFTGGVAHYTTTSNLDSTVVSATADIYDGWSGEFNLSHGPCNEVTTTTTSTTTTTTTTSPPVTTTPPATTSPPVVTTAPPAITTTTAVVAQPRFTG